MGMCCGALQQVTPERQEGPEGHGSGARADAGGAGKACGDDGRHGDAAGTAQAGETLLS